MTRGLPRRGQSRKGCPVQNSWYDEPDDSEKDCSKDVGEQR